MINENRIVPVEKIDLISLYGLILKQDSNNSSLAKLAANTVDGEFQVKTNSAVLLADQPAKVIDFDTTASSVTAGTVYFVPSFDYEGFTINGAAVVPTGDVVADGVSLYKAVLSSGAITITKVGF